MSASPSAVRTALAWLTLLACVWMVGAVPVSETVCVSGMVMTTPTCEACVHHAPSAATGLTAAAPGGPHTTLKSLCCIERTNQVTPAVPPAAPPQPQAMVAATVPLAPLAPMAPPSAPAVPAFASPPPPPHDTSPLVLRL